VGTGSQRSVSFSGFDRSVWNFLAGHGDPRLRSLACHASLLSGFATAGQATDYLWQMA
jgi:hypothetical protein